MDKNRADLGLIALCVLTLSMVLFFILITGNTSYNVAAPCVDGDGDVNLEGIMCEKTINQFFGYEVAGEGNTHLLLFILILASVGSLMCGLIAFGGFLTYNLFTDNSGGAKNG